MLELKTTMLIFQKVLLPYNLINENTVDNLINKIYETNFQKCSYQHGYIKKVVKVLKVGENVIDPVSSCVVFEVLFEAETIKPEKNSVFTGKVYKIFSEGIFVDIDNLFKVNIPSDQMKNFVFDSDVYTNKSVKISVNTEVQVKILMTKYEKKGFKCIGQLEKVHSLV